MQARSATQSLPPMRRFPELLALHDGFILDVWGVLHDGQAPYGGAAAALALIAASGKPAFLLSNAPRRAGGVVARLVEIGFDAGHLPPVLSSGEAVWQLLRDRDLPFFAGLGNRLHHIGPPRDANVYEGLDYALEDDPAAADFVLNTGIDDFDETLDDYEDRLQACIAARLPMICANPDLVVNAGARLVICAGTLAARYAQLGGQVLQVGKPHKLVYELALARLGLPAGRVLAVGDSLHTDIAGANAMGLPSALCLAGIHREEFDPARPALLADAFAAHGARPDFMIEGFGD